jgi:exosortase
VAALAVILGFLAFAYTPLVGYTVGKWLEPDYSHGFLVPLFAGYLAWKWRDRAPDKVAWPNPVGLAFLAVGTLLFVFAGFFNTGKEWIQGFSLILNLCGIAWMMGGLPALKWLWPAFAFLLFMFPLPYRVEHALGWQLQKVAATGATFVLQTVGYPTYLEGVVITAGTQKLEVEKACNGLSMLLTFIALSTAMAIVVNRRWLDRGLILASAIPVAILANVTRIAVTGILFNEVGGESAKVVFHDVAGWLMMLFALGVIGLELKLLDWVLLEDLRPATREEMIRENSINPAYLFMTGVSAGKPAAPKPAPEGSRGPSR